LNYLDNLH